MSTKARIVLVAAAALGIGCGSRAASEEEDTQAAPEPATNGGEVVPTESSTGEGSCGAGTCSAHESGEEGAPP